MSKLEKLLTKHYDPNATGATEHLKGKESKLTSNVIGELLQDTIALDELRKRHEVLGQGKDKSTEALTEYEKRLNALKPNTFTGLFHSLKYALDDILFSIKTFFTYKWKMRKILKKEYSLLTDEETRQVVSYYIRVIDRIVAKGKEVDSSLYVIFPEIKKYDELFEYHQGMGTTFAEDQIGPHLELEEKFRKMQEIFEDPSYTRDKDA